MSNDSMSRRAALAGLGVAGAGAAIAALGTPTHAAEAGSLADHPMCGVWHCMVNSADPEAPQIANIALFWADGTAMLAFPVTQRIPGGMQYNSACHGIWRAETETRAQFTCTQLMSDAEGNYTGSVTIDGHPEVGINPDTFSDDGLLVVITIRDATGAIVAQVSGNDGRAPVRGLRMVFGAPNFPPPLAD